MQRWTDDQLRQAVAESNCLSKTIRALGLRPVGANYDTIRRAINRLELNTAHWGRIGYLSTTKADLVDAVTQSDSIASCITRLGWPVTASTRRRFRAIVEAYGINTSHFLGQASHRGKKYPNRGRPLVQFLAKNGPSVSSHDLRRRLLAEGFFQPRCAGCWRYAWNGHPIPLELEHKNGDRYDNRLEIWSFSARTATR